MYLTDRGMDNPDQRIAEDVRFFVDNTLVLGLGLLRSVVSVIFFITLLWSLSQPINVFGVTIQITSCGWEYCIHCLVLG